MNNEVCTDEEKKIMDLLKGCSDVLESDTVQFKDLKVKINLEDPRYGTK